MKLAEQKTLYLKAKKAYYNDDQIMTDAAFDKLEDEIRAADPSWSELKKTGVRVKVKKTEVTLTHPMPSLNKVYPEAAPKWLAKHGTRYVVMDKLDGGSFQLTVHRGVPQKLVTRGDGEVGGDISFLLPFLLPKKLKTDISGVFRCEAVMPRTVFKDKYSAVYENPRNLVNGALNRAMEIGKAPSGMLRDIQLVVLGMYGINLTTGLKAAKAAGLECVHHTRLSLLEVDELSARLKARRKHGPYEIDGLVIAPVDFVLDYETADKPKNIVAFKMNDEENAATVVVDSIVYQVTSHGRIVPKVKIKPTRMDGVTVTFATVHNAEWMLERKIGPGAEIKILRSGGVIPKIVGVVKPGKIQYPDMPYRRDGVHFVVQGSIVGSSEDDRMRVLRILKFMRTLGVELVADRTIEQCLTCLKSAPHWVYMWHSKKLSQKLINAGIGKKQAQNIVHEMDRVLGSKIPLAKLMIASHRFDVGVGLRRLQMIEASGVSMGKLLVTSWPLIVERLQEIKGFSEKTARLVADGVLAFNEVYGDSYRPYLKIDDGIPKTKKKVSGQLYGQYVSFTSYRDKTHEAAIEASGGEVVPFGSKTTILIYKEGGKSSSKLDKAAAKGIKVTTFSELNLPT